MGCGCRRYVGLGGDRAGPDRGNAGSSGEPEAGRACDDLGAHVQCVQELTPEAGWDRLKSAFPTM